MPSKQKPHDIDPEISLGDAATQFLSTVPAESGGAQQEIFKFIRWYGETRKIRSITGRELANYSEQINASPTTSGQHLTAIKGFLLYAHKQGLTDNNLSAHVRIRKAPTTGARSSVAAPDSSIAMTSRGHEELSAILAKLKEERPRIAEELRKAAADKDFRENAPLEAARERQGHVEGKIRELEDTIKRAKIVEAAAAGTMKITLGDLVTICDIESGEKIDYTLVGAKEANIRHCRISMVSPMGQALFNKERGDVLEVSAPSGILKYKIIEITRS
jgi:transcription elongation factor GreA